MPPFPLGETRPVVCSICSWTVEKLPLVEFRQRTHPQKNQQHETKVGNKNSVLATVQSSRIGEELAACDIAGGRPACEEMGTCKYLSGDCSLLLTEELVFFFLRDFFFSLCLRASATLPARVIVGILGQGFLPTHSVSLMGPPILGRRASIGDIPFRPLCFDSDVRWRRIFLVSHRGSRLC